MDAEMFSEDTIYLLIRFSKASEKDYQCRLCRDFLQSQGFRTLVVACRIHGKELRIVDLNNDPRSVLFARMFPLGDVKLPAIVYGRRYLNRVDALHPLHLCSLLFGDVTKTAMALPEAAKIGERTVKKAGLTGPEFLVLSFIQEGYTAKEIAEKTGYTEAHVKNIIRKLKEKGVAK